jgi:MFS family permease
MLLYPQICQWHRPIWHYLSSLIVLNRNNELPGWDCCWRDFGLGLCISSTAAMGWSSYHHHTGVVVMLSCLCQGLELVVAIGWIPETLSPHHQQPLKHFTNNNNNNYHIYDRRDTNHPDATITSWVGRPKGVTAMLWTAVLSKIIYGLTKVRQVMYIALCIGALSSTAFPTISAMKPNIVEASERGRIHGALYSIQAVAAGIGPMAMQMIDNATLRLHQLQQPEQPEHLTPRSEGGMFFFATFIQSIALVGTFHLPRNKCINNSNDVPLGGSTF